MPYIDDNTDNYIRGVWEKLDAPARDIIRTSAYKLAVDEATAAYQIKEDDRVTLREEVLLVLLGLQTEQELLAQVDAMRLIPKAELPTVFKYVNDHIFVPLAKARTAPPSPLKKYVETQDTIGKRFAQLPEPVRTAILSETIGRAFLDACTAAKLSTQQIDVFGAQVALVTVGLATTKDFRDNTTRELKLEDGVRNTLLQAVEQSVFRPVRDAIVRALSAKKSTVTQVPEPKIVKP